MERINRAGRSSALSQKSTNTPSLMKKKDYGTLTEYSHEDPNEIDPDVEEEQEFYRFEMTIDDAMNKLKNYHLFFYIGIIPMILSFSFSDMIVDSLNFLELVPDELECKTNIINPEGENVWVPCDKDDI